MKKRSKLLRVLRRDEGLFNTIIFMGFSIFVMVTLFNLITIGGDLLNKAKTFDEVKYPLQIFGQYALMFALALFYLLVVKKKHLNNRTSVIITAICSILFGIYMYKEVMQPSIFFFIAWVVFTIVAYLIVRYIIRDLYRNHYDDV